MEKSLKIGILRETKNPPDRRVPLTPPQIITLQELYPDIEFYKSERAAGRIAEPPYCPGLRGTAAFSGLYRRI